MANTGVQAERVATAISAIKWVLIMLAAVSAIVGAINYALNDTSVTSSVTVALIMVLGAAVWSLLVWVLFGWFEHTLLALVAIARNTSGHATATRPAVQQRV